MDDLGPDVYAIDVSEAGDLLPVSTHPDHDETSCPHYPPLQELQRPDPVKTVSRSDLRELDRLGPNVDLVSYHDETHSLTNDEEEGPRREEPPPPPAGRCIQVLLPLTISPPAMGRDEPLDAPSPRIPTSCPSTGL